MERFGRIRKGFRCLLNRRRVAGWELEALVGHVTLLGLLRRETFSLFHCLPVSLARKFHHRRELLWISARAELEAFVGVMILMESDWARPGLSSGNGEVQSFWAFQSAGFCVDSRFGQVLRDGFGRPISLDPEMVEILTSERWETNPTCSEVPSHLFLESSAEEGHGRQVVYRRRYPLEARALVRAAQRAPTANQHTTADCYYSVTIFQWCSASTAGDRATSDP